LCCLQDINALQRFTLTRIVPIHTRIQWSLDVLSPLAQITMVIAPFHKRGRLNNSILFGYCLSVCVTNMFNVRLGPPVCARVRIPVKFTFVHQKKFIFWSVSLLCVSYRTRWKKITVVIRFVTRTINNYVVCNIKPYILQQVLRRTWDSSPQHIDSGKCTKKKLCTDLVLFSHCSIEPHSPVKYNYHYSLMVTARFKNKCSHCSLCDSYSKQQRFWEFKYRPYREFNSFR
jgi:hypothetical protein